MVTLNVDLAERAAEPAELYALTHIANLACGGHAGDPVTLARALSRCREHRVTVAAHPSYPDREGFGWRRLPLAPAEVASSVRAQCLALAEAAAAAGLPVELMKPHGALYHAADDDDVLALEIILASLAVLPDLRGAIGPAGGALARAAAAAGLTLHREGYADSEADEIAPGRYRLRPLLITDPAAAVARAAAIAGEVDTLCVHGDNPGAVEVARAVRAYLDETPTPMGQDTPVPPIPQ